MILSKILIDACKINGTFTSATIRHFGLTFSEKEANKYGLKMVSYGWPKKLIGKEISQHEYEMALEGRKILRSKCIGSTSSISGKARNIN
jgi:hypothetical protein